MIETCVYYWDPQPRTLSRNTLDLLQDEHSKTGEPLRVIMHAWGSPATGANPFVSSSYFPSFGVLEWKWIAVNLKHDWCKTIWSDTDGPFSCVCISFELQRPILWSDLFALPHARRRRYSTCFCLNLFFCFVSLSFSSVLFLFHFLLFCFNRANVRPIPEHLEIYLHFPNILRWEYETQ